MQLGWVRIDRSLVEHWLHNDKPFCRFGAWVDLILMANHEMKKFPGKAGIVTVERGQLLTSLRSLSTRWGWSKDKVTYFLNILESDEMITRSIDANGTLVTIVNYSVYQDVPDTNRTQNGRKSDSKRTEVGRSSDAYRTHIGRNKNDNNEEQLNNETMQQKPIRPERFFPDNDLLEKTFADFRDMRKKIKAPMTDRAVDLMVGKIKKLDPGTAVKMLEQSIMNGWKDIYELKDDKKDPAGNRQQPRGRFTNFPQRTYTSEELAEFERRKLGY